MSSGNRPREQKGARKTGLLEHLEATGAAGQRTMSGSLNLRGVGLHLASLYGADLTGADLTGAVLSGATYNAKTRWPVGFEPPVATA